MKQFPPKQEVIHRGVGIMVTNQSKELFYLQLKDEQYQIKELRLHYTVFGGHCREGEEEYLALQRELKEELKEGAASLVYTRAHKIASYHIIPTLGPLTGENFLFTLFESILSEKELSWISSLPIFEGKEGVLLSRKELLHVPFVVDLRSVLLDYVKELDSLSIQTSRIFDS